MQTFDSYPQLIYYCLQNSPWGTVAVGLWQGKICHISFANTKEKALEHVTEQFPEAQIVATTVYPIDWQNLLRGKSHYDFVFFGTDFQKIVWQELLNIPIGKTITYAQLATRIKQPTATRAAASAVAQNNLALLVPCHRVVHTIGNTHKYRWGAKLKKTLLEWEKEAAKTSS